VPPPQEAQHAAPQDAS
jgi:hypothetical protein